ncbi:MAG: type IV pilus twitching motility protein PilT [Elusimicrobiota bacterium]
MEINKIISIGVDMGASDVHISPTRVPMIRVLGELKPIEGLEKLTKTTAKNLIYSMLSEEQKKIFETSSELDCSYELNGVGRFRVNVFMQKDGIGAVLRIIPTNIPSTDDLKLSDPIKDLAKLNKGLVLVTGPTGSGKSTTLASLINTINKQRKDHILTIEDPIEYVYEQEQCVITQREVGGQTETFASALKHALRQDPDVILVGELRDLETIQAALTLAETGHVVFATLHTTDAAQTIDRVIDVFPPHQQQQIRVLLSNTLKAVVAQRLLLTADGKSRVAVREVMIVTPAIANLIREGKTHQVYSAIETGKVFGMISMDKAVSELFKSGVISKETAQSITNKPGGQAQV